jgi:two-component system, NarL family, nitrate/nitrite response regulator NarL
VRQPHRANPWPHLTHPTLTVPMRIMVGLYGDGWTVKEIARALSLSPYTVGGEMKKLRRRYTDAGRPTFTKLDFRARALEDGILTPEPGEPRASH